MTSLDAHLDNWIQALCQARGHNHLGEPVDGLLNELRSAALQAEDAEALFVKAIQGLSDEIATAVSYAAHPPATIVHVRFFMNLQNTGQPYVVDRAWPVYLNKLFGLLHRFHDALLLSRNLASKPFGGDIAEKLAVLFYPVQGSALRGPQFDVEIRCNAAPAAKLLEGTGFLVPERDKKGFSEVDGPNDDSMFSVESDEIFLCLLTGAAKSRDPFSKRLIEFYTRDEENWVRYHAERLLSMYFEVGR